MKKSSFDTEVEVVCLVDNITIAGVNYAGVKGKKIKVSSDIVGTLLNHSFIEKQSTEVKNV